MKKKIALIFIITISISAPAFPYAAKCYSENNRTFSIHVKDRVMTVDRKFRHYYEGRSYNGWYIYSNSKYTYKTAPFKENGFRIYVIDHNGAGYTGWCDFL